MEFTKYTLDEIIDFFEKNPQVKRCTLSGGDPLESLELCELVLDSKNTNYSYGSLQRILRLGLKNIGFDKIVPMDHILVLGVAGGSVIKTLVEDFNEFVLELFKYLKILNKI